mmetsp:Transcript_11567/g.17602  ORF Transcript_11567/g.17602 Transcript_11567/m.17602 type:complete len:229 (+) Transcript_11567:107-793(+)
MFFPYRSNRFSLWQLALCIVITAALSDICMSQTTGKIEKCLVDNIGHALLSCLMWVSALIPRDGSTSRTIPSKGLDSHGGSSKHSIWYLELGAAFALGSLLDIDHFVMGGSLSLTSATSLPSRPFGHSVAFVIVMSFFAMLFTGRYRYALLTFVSLLTHQLRDATRRGLWMWPLGSTPPIWYALYLFILALAVFVIHNMAAMYFLSAHVSPLPGSNLVERSRSQLQNV